ncbi:MAG: hypothetical protein AABX29_01470 [Nanoarchaeota archaeon]
MSLDIKLGIITKKEEHNGLEVALINKTSMSRGVQLGVGNVAGKSSYGVQLGGINVVNILY